MALANVLHDPNLLLSIFEQLADWNGSLSSAARVNTAWFEEATNVLWRHAEHTLIDAPRTLLERVAADRRQIYAGKMYRMGITLGDPDKSHRAFTGLRFPRLKVLVIHTAPDDTDKWYDWTELYLLSSLEEIWLRGGFLPEMFFERLASCSRLRSIQFEDIDTGNINPDRFLSFFKSCRSLNTVCLMQSMEKLISNEVYLQVARQAGMKSLSVGRLIEHDLFKKLICENPESYRGLWKLIHKVTAVTVPLLIESVNPNLLRRLFLEIVDGGEDVLGCIASLRRLTHLGIEWSDDPIMSPSSLLAIRDLPLRKLSLCSLELSPDIFDITDEEFKKFISGLHELRSFEFKVQNKLTNQAFFHLAKSCRLLEECDIVGEFDLQTLEACDGVALPRMRLLTLDAIVPDTVPQHLDAKSMAELITRHAPELKMLRCYGGNKLTIDTLRLVQDMY